MGTRKDLTGQKFGKLTIIEYAYTDNYRRAIWKCQCECGNIVEVRGDMLRNGNTKSCGCLCTTHHKSNTRLYHIWQQAKDRCYNKNNKDYQDYGGRGIDVCQEWKDDFTAFYNWAMENGYKENLTIDRIDFNGNYGPSNCRWLTNLEQQRNKRNNIKFTYKGETHCLTEWCNILGLKYGRVRNRVRRLNWPIERALELEVK